MSDDVMLQEAKKSVRRGQRVRARDLLTRLLRADQANPNYWLWMSSVVETVKEQVYCLQQVLRLDPKNHAAKQGLIMIGALSTDKSITPLPPVPRDWQSELEEETLPDRKGIWSNPVLRVAVPIGTGIVVIGLVLGGIFGFGSREPAQVAMRPTKTPGPSPTFTLTPTSIESTKVIKDTPTPTIAGPEPLWMSLEVTYTPTPLYINTPHPISEAYRLGQRAIARGDYVIAIRFLKDAIQNEPNAADIYYYMGEIHRLTGNYEEALAAYKQALTVDPSFAPAYLGRARASSALDPQFDMGEDLVQAIDSDSKLFDAHIELVTYHIAQEDNEPALVYLQAAETLMPDSPLIYFMRAQLALQVGEYEEALDAAQEAHNLDITYLPAYLALGHAALANGEFDDAVDKLEIYVRYEQDDPFGWLLLGRAYAEIAKPEQGYTLLIQSEGDPDYKSALEAFDRAVELDDQLQEVSLYRGITYLALDEGQKAVNEFFLARKLDKESLLISLLMGRALIEADRSEDGFAQITGSLNMAESDEQLAAMYFVRAQAAERVDRKSVAVADWNALLALPEDSVPETWVNLAEERLFALTAPTPTPTTTGTSTATITITKSPTPNLTPTRTTIH